MYFTEKQLAILEFIHEWREEKGFSPTLDELASHFGVTKITIHEHLNQLERKGAIRREKYRARSIEVLAPPQPRRRRFSFPFVGTIRAGAPIETVETEDSLELDEFFPPERTCYLLRVRGNSMVEDHIQEGDYVVVESRKTANNGDTVVAVLENGEATLKRYYRERGRIRLQPANGAMDPIYVRNVEIRGVVVGLLRRFQR